MLRTTPNCFMMRNSALLLLHGKCASRRPVRTQHSELWWKKAKSNPLSAKTLEERADRPSFPAFSEEVDRPHVIPDGAKCFQCNKGIDPEIRDNLKYIWVPSGNAASPTPSGYFFHHGCFHCARCKFRFMHNKFYSLDNQAVCINCALGRPSQWPTRWWHGSSKTVTPGRMASRVAGRQFPRHQHQMEFLYDPDA